MSRVRRVSFTPERHLPTPGQCGHSPHRHTAAGTAAPTTTDTGNTVPQRTNPTHTAYAHPQRGAQAFRARTPPPCGILLRYIANIPHACPPLRYHNGGASSRYVARAPRARRAHRRLRRADDLERRPGDGRGRHGAPRAHRPNLPAGPQRGARPGPPLCRRRQPLG